MSQIIDMIDPDLPPILRAKRTGAPSVFRPENLLREARRQRGLAATPVPELCVLDPDGDIVRALRRDGRGRISEGWACYHTEMLEFELAGQRIGIVGCAVGASFAVLVAEEIFASGGEMLISITSAGRVDAALPDGAFFMLIERALRDEGTSYHYLPPEEPFAHADAALLGKAERALATGGMPAGRGIAWTTDAPFRETEAAIAWAAAQGAQVVEMEAAALYAFAQARGKNVLCLAHVTNQMAQNEGDFEKGAQDGAIEALRVLAALASLHSPR